MAPATLTTRSRVRPSLPSAAGPDRRIIQLDFVRGVAILLVINYHAMTRNDMGYWAERILSATRSIGWMGVDLFFVLSGFLVGGLLVQELLKSGTIRIKRFLVRRMFKIWPAYYFYILFQIGAHRHPLGTFWWQNVLNIQNYVGTSLNHTWSLAVEEHFYLLLPVVLLRIYRGRFTGSHVIRVLIGICGAVLVIRTISFLAIGPGLSQWETHTRLDSLLFGVVLSYFMYTSRERFDHLLTRRILLAFLSILVFAIALVVGGHQSAYMSTVGYTVNYICFAALMLLIYGYRGPLIQTPIYRAAAWIGRYSYGIYLWHLSVREAAVRLCSRLPSSYGWLALLIVQYVAAIVLGVLVTKLIEFPMLRVRDRFFPRGVAEPPPAQP
jgi:peptidoglycan/LPS O-acetylase OafA/YrhL